MTSVADPEEAGSPEEAIWDAIASFEHILEALPNDHTSLETLARAYSQIGDHARAKDYLVRLSEVVLKEGDAGALTGLADRLRAYIEYDDKVTGLIDRIEVAQSGGGPAVTPDGRGGGRVPLSKGPVSASLSKFNLTAEMSMAWNLMEAGELSQDEYAQVVQDLTELSGQRGGGTVSTLHVVEAHGGMDLERILGFLSRECGTPIISLDNFEVNMDAMQLVPRDFMVQRGAIVFELLGTDALVAILNPYDPELRKDVKAVVGRDCHFYLVPASQFDRRITRLDDAAEESHAS